MVSTTTEVFRWALWDPAVALFLSRSRDRAPFLFDGVCWRVVSSTIAMDFETMTNYRKFVLERLSVGECSSVEPAAALVSAE
jgi:hypothetical protein